MKVYIIYNMYVNPHEYRELPECNIVGVYSDKLTALKMACAKQIEEYTNCSPQGCLDDLPEFPNVNDDCEIYQSYFDLVTNLEFRQDVNIFGMEYFYIKEMNVI